MAAELKIGIGADNSGLKDALKDSEAQIKSFFKNLEGLNKIGEQLSSIGQKMSVGLTLPILALGGSAIKAYGDIQALQKGLEAVMGSAGFASKEFEKLKDVARLPGLGMEEAVRGSINLQAIGIDADKSRKILSQFGNAVASVGKGKAEFERAIYGVQQLANTDFPLGEDLNIIKDALPQVSNLLKEAFGSSRSDELAKMGVSSAQVLDTITKGLEKLPRVTGGINGAFENLGDSMKTSLARIGKVIDDTFDISGIIDKLTGYLDTAISYFEGLSPAVQKTILVVTGLVAAAGPLLVIIGGLIQAFPILVAGIGGVGLAFSALTGPIGLVVLGIGAIIAAVVSNWSKITPYLVRTTNNFIELYNESQTFRGGILSIGFAFESLYAVIKSFVISAYNTLKSFGKGVLSLFEGVSLMIRGAFDLNPAMISEGWAKANAKVSMSFDNISARLDGVAGKYNKLLKNDKPLKFVTEADLNIDTDKATTKAATKTAAELKKKIKEKPIKVELPDFEVIGGSQNFNFIDDFGNEVANAWNLEDKFNEIADRMRNSVPIITTALTEAQAELLMQGADFNAAVNEMFQDNLSNFFGGIGESLVNGGNIIRMAGSFILGTLGDLATMLGKELIKTAVIAQVFGALLIAIRKAVANPVALIAIAGAALVVGAALTAASKNTASVGSGGGGSVPSGGGGGSQSYSSSFSGGGAGGDGRVVFEISGNNLIGVLDRAKDRNTRLGG